jgi:hypothetical protein
MLVYVLMYPDNGCLAEGGLEYYNLDEIRDVALGLAAETNRSVAICENYGIAENIIEIVTP